MTDFDQFWNRFPRRIGKFDAMRAYEKARRLATAAQILDGVDAYVIHKPHWQDFCHPATWLNQGRWLDEWVTTQGLSAECPHDPPCEKRWACGRKQQMEQHQRVG